MIAPHLKCVAIVSSKIWMFKALPIFNISNTGPEFPAHDCIAFHIRNTEEFLQIRISVIFAEKTRRNCFN